MPAALRSNDETARLQALRRYNVQNTPPEQNIDRLTAITARLFNMPVACLTLVYKDTVCFHACSGIAMPAAKRKGSLWAYTLESLEPFVVPDLQRDLRFSDSPLVSDPFHFRFYAGVPLQTPEGYRIGTLSVLDYQPRSFPAEHEADLMGLAQMVMNQLELRLSTQLIKTEVSRRKSAEEKTKHLTYHDRLTGLPNRMLLLDRLTMMIVQSRRLNSAFAVLVLDLDRFKVVNDSLGHHIGDQILLGVAERLSDTVRAIDTVARLGGDEFVILLPDVQNNDQVEQIADRIFVAMKPPFQIDGHEFFVTTSIGASVYPLDGEDADTLIKNAEIALYRVKNAGRNACHLFTPLMNPRALEQLSLETSLHKALANNEFQVYYQPKVALATGKIVGMEALVRWNSPERGMVSPADFIPLAEETGLIVPIGQWVLETACRQTRRWHRMGFHTLQVAVNLSLRQFQQPDLVPYISQTLRKTDLEPRFLDLEITESVAMDSIDSKIAIMNDLKALGIKISLDDFGTGFSSLSYLRRLPIDVLKVDQSFVRTSMVEERDAAIVRAIILMAHSLNLQVIAEGVETWDQFDFLQEQECDSLQGYLFSKPVAAEEFTTLLTEGKSLLLDKEAALRAA